MRPIIKHLSFVLLTGLFFYSSCRKEHSCEHCTGVNQPPIAIAGADQTESLPDPVIVLDGSASSDPDNNISSYSWEKLSGPSSFHLSNTNAAKTQATQLAEGVYQFVLTVTDSEGLYSKDTVKLTVRASAGLKRILNAGPDITLRLPLDSVWLAGTADVFSNSLKWTWLSGPVGSVIVPDVIYPAIAMLKIAAPGEYSFRLSATYGSETISDTMSLLVADDPQDPNTITFNHLPWELTDLRGTGQTGLYLFSSAQPQLFFISRAFRPAEVYLQLDDASPWFQLSPSSSGIEYGYETDKPFVWATRNPADPAWVGKKSSLKVKLL